MKRMSSKRRINRWCGCCRYERQD